MFNKVDASAISNKQLPLNKEGNLNVFWYDAHFEEYNNTDGTVLIFGKCFDPMQNKYMSIAV